VGWTDIHRWSIASKTIDVKHLRSGSRAVCFWYFGFFCRLILLKVSMPPSLDWVLIRVHIPVTFTNNRLVSIRAFEAQTKFSTELLSSIN
jgi:hypothetical protein